MSAMDTAVALWVLYHHETEAFDRTLDHRISEHGCAIVAPWHRAESVRFASVKMREMRGRFASLGLPLELFQDAKEQVSRLNDYGESMVPWAREYFGA